MTRGSARAVLRVSGGLGEASVAEALGLSADNHRAHAGAAGRRAPVLVDHRLHPLARVRPTQHLHADQRQLLREPRAAADDVRTLDIGVLLCEVRGGRRCRGDAVGRRHARVAERRQLFGQRLARGGRGVRDEKQPLAGPAQRSERVWTPRHDALPAVEHAVTVEDDRVERGDDRGRRAELRAQRGQQPAAETAERPLRLPQQVRDGEAGGEGRHGRRRARHVTPAVIPRGRCCRQRRYRATTRAP
eukprot:1159491-Prymnesium_polylepis.1